MFKLSLKVGPKAISCLLSCFGFDFIYWLFKNLISGVSYTSVKKSNNNPTQKTSSLNSEGLAYLNVVVSLSNEQRRLLLYILKLVVVIPAVMTKSVVVFFFACFLTDSIRANL